MQGKRIGRINLAGAGRWDTNPMSYSRQLLPVCAFALTPTADSYHRTVARLETARFRVLKGTPFSRGTPSRASITVRISHLQKLVVRPKKMANNSTTKCT